MKRKDFFKNLLLGGTGLILARGAVKADPPVATQKIWLATLFIAGFGYYDGPDAESLLQTGMPLTLNRQPHNEYDKHAIEILSGEAKLGYIPRRKNIAIAKLMDEGITVQAEIKELFPDAGFFNNVKVDVWYDRPVKPSIITVKDNAEIRGFGHWLIPSGEGVVYLEGMPSEEERALDRQNTAERRKVWQPDKTALSVYKKLKLWEGRYIIAQFWTVLMVYSEDEGPLPFSCELLKVFTKSIQEEDREFIQLFIEIRHPKNLSNGNLGGSAIDKNRLNLESGIYTYNCSSIYSIKEY